VIVDTHTHVIAPDQTRYPLAPAGLDQGTGSQRRAAVWFREVPVSAEQLREHMSHAGVDRALLVQAMGAYSYDNSYAADAARAYPREFASVAIVDVGRDDAVSRLRYWVNERDVRGVRLFTIGNPEATWLDAPAGFRVWEEAGRLGIPVVVTILSRQLAKLRNALRRFPEIPVALDHCGFPDLRGGAPFAKAQGLFELVEFPNLHLKVTSHVLEHVEADAAGPEGFVELLAQRFGAQRLLWGSDYPQTHDRTYSEFVALAQRAAARLSASDGEAFLGETALRMWPELRRAAPGAEC
jgi:predicted TIM-barrel fold metal-dependent hydrolase